MTQNEKTQNQSKGHQVVTRLFLILVAIIMLYPLAWNVVSSFKTSTEFLTDPFAWPQGLAWDKLVRAYEKSNLAANIGNSIYVVLETLVIIVICVCRVLTALCGISSPRKADFEHLHGGHLHSGHLYYDSAVLADEQAEPAQQPDGAGRAVCNDAVPVRNLPADRLPAQHPA